MRKGLRSPFFLPIWMFAFVALVGAVLLRLPVSTAPNHVSWLDALFTSVSAVCVTGLVVVDTGSFYTAFGQGVILALIQLGGLGIMTYTTLAIYLLRRRVTLGDRLAVGQSLLHDPSFHLGRFLRRVVAGVVCIEAVGAVLLFLLDPVGFGPYSAVFHSISAFCNAGFSLYADSLTAWQADVGVNLVFMVLIVLGGLGFAVLHELAGLAVSCAPRPGKRRKRQRPRLSWHARVVLGTTAFLILAGAGAIFAAEIAGGRLPGPWDEKLLISFFTSVTCRTAGFNTVDVAHLTNVSLAFMLGLMFVGGSPGSCAGGVKTTTFRAWWGFIVAQVRGRRQVVVGRMGLSREGQDRAFTLLIFAMVIIGAATIILIMTEGGDVPHDKLRGHFLETLFEAVSAFGTVGLSTGMTAKLTGAGKALVIMLMFVGRLGPVWLLAAWQSWQRQVRYSLPEDELPFG